MTDVFFASCPAAARAATSWPSERPPSASVPAWRNARRERGPGQRPLDDFAALMGGGPWGGQACRYQDMLIVRSGQSREPKIGISSPGIDLARTLWIVT